MLVSRLFICLLKVCISGVSFADEGPLAGQVYNFKLNERIHYSCQPGTGTEIKCKFTRASVAPLISPNEVPERKSASLKDLSDPSAFEAFSKGSCDVVDRVEKELLTDDESELNYLPKADRDRVVSAFRAVCEKKDRASVEEFLDLTIDMESRICVVSTFGWTGNFSKNDEKTWVRTDRDGPVGDGCGGLYLDRFELSDTGSFWDLVRLEVASNPNGTFTTGQACSEVYTGEETVYRWQGGDLPARCDYIRLNLYD